MTELTKHSVEYATFTLEREYPVPRERVFAAFADKEQKAAWFGGGNDPETRWDFDFREGAREYQSGQFMGQLHTFDAIYHDIVENERIAYSYTMHVDDVRLSASLTVIEFTPTAGGTRLVFTEQGAFFDGHEEPGLREQGLNQILDALGASFAATTGDDESR
jgi:uncharacterized protein YndB with AHSA1/START domain